MTTPDTGKLIIDTFKKFDSNQDGKISRDELKRVLKAIGGGNFDDASVDAMLQASDTNKDGFIQYEEFVNWVTQDMGKPQQKAGGGKDALDKRGAFSLDYRKLLPTRFEVDIKERYNMENHEIGAGGFGKVFVARDKAFDNRKVAVKKVQKTTKTPTESGSLDKEIQVMKELDHPNICKLLATFEEGRNIFFIMELCEGGEVFDRIIENGFITERVSATILAQVCSALAYAHYRGIAHRDIKPENVVFCTKDADDNRVKVIDWGLATNFTGGAKMTKAVGSMTYAAPEVIGSNDQKAYTAACDLWSVGVLAYVMLCGKPPFWGSRDQHYKNAKNERYPFKDPPWDRMNENAKDFVRKLLKAKPDERLPIEKVVQHPWLVAPPDEVNSAASSSVVSNLKAFSAQSTFSRICITAVARQLDHKQLKDIHQVFRAMDLDGNGVLTADEVKQGLGAMGGQAGMDIDKLFANLDMDGSQTIDYTEFCAAGLDQKLSSQEDVIWAAFKTFDLDNVGYISVENLKTILDNADIRDVWSAEVCQDVGKDIIATFDKDGDGMISFDDWRKLMEQCWNKKHETVDEGLDGMSAYDLLTKVSKLEG